MFVLIFEIINYCKAQKMQDLHFSQCDLQDLHFSQTKIICYLN